MSLLGALWRPKLRLLNGSYHTAESIFRFHHHAHDRKVGLQLFKFSLMFKLELLENCIELTLRCADLLRNSIRTVLQSPRMSRIDYPPPGVPEPKNKPRSAIVPASSLQP
jgi:hypothetical protein